jgi:hypothetical protein
MPLRHWNDGQELVFEDLNAGPRAIVRELYDRVVYEMLKRQTDAFFAESFLVEYATPTSVTVRAGSGFQQDSSQVSPEPTKRLLYRATQPTLVLSAPDASLDRIDIVVTRAAIADELTATRKYKDASTAAVSNQLLTVQKDWEAELEIVVGTPNVSPVAPATPAGYIKIAELDVTAVSGLSGAGAVTDTRVKLPIQGDILLNTLGYDRLPAAAATSLDDLFAAADALFKNGNYEYWDSEDLGSAPANPSAGKLRLYFESGLFYYRDSAGVASPVGGGAGGGGGAQWNQTAGVAPLAAEENGEQVYLYEQGISQTLTLWLKVPQGYIAGRQIKMYLSAYSPSSSNNWEMRVTSYLVRKNNDAVTSVANSRVEDTGDILNTVANQYRELTFNLTDGAGAINSLGVSPGDLIRLELTRIAPTGSEDTADVRFIPSSTEVKFI